MFLEKKPLQQSVCSRLPNSLLSCQLQRYRIVFRKLCKLAATVWHLKRLLVMTAVLPLCRLVSQPRVASFERTLSVSKQDSTASLCQTAGWLRYRPLPDSMLVEAGYCLPGQSRTDLRQRKIAN